MTLEEVRWSPRAVVCALPRINVSEFIHPPPHIPPPKWTLKNVDLPDELVEVTGPTVGKAIEQVLEKRARPGKGEVRLRIVGGGRLQDLTAGLPRGPALEFISVLDAKVHAFLEAPRVLKEYPDVEDWMAVVKNNGWDVNASLDQVLSKRRMAGPT
jgi:hypothetical protein